MFCSNVGIWFQSLSPNDSAASAIGPRSPGYMVIKEWAATPVLSCKKWAACLQVSFLVSSEVV